MQRRGEHHRCIRPVARRIQAHFKFTDAQRSPLGTTVRDAEPTLVPAPTTEVEVPTVTVEAAGIAEEDREDIKLPLNLILLKIHRIFHNPKGY